MEQALQDIQFLSKRFAGILALAEKIEQYQKIDNQIKEGGAALEKLTQKLDEADKSLVAIANDKQDIMQQMDQMIIDARKEADRIITEASKRADAIFSEGKESYVKMRKSATQEIEALTQKAQSLRNEVASFEARIEELQKKEDEITQKILKLKERLDVSN